MTPIFLIWEHRNTNCILHLSGCPTTSLAAMSDLSLFMMARPQSAIACWQTSARHSRVSPALAGQSKFINSPSALLCSLARLPFPPSCLFPGCLTTLLQAALGYIWGQQAFHPMPASDWILKYRFRFFLWLCEKNIYATEIASKKNCMYCMKQNKCSKNQLVSAITVYWTFRGTISNQTKTEIFGGTNTQTHNANDAVIVADHPGNLLHKFIEAFCDKWDLTVTMDSTEIKVLQNRYLSNTGKMSVKSFWQSLDILTEV